MADDDSIENLFACQAESDAESDVDSTPQIISRQDAIALGFVTYFTGKPCKHGHIAERYAGKGYCIGCDIAHRETNRENLAEYNKAYRANNKEAMSEQRKAYYTNNKEAILRNNKTYRATHKEIRTKLDKQRRQTDIQYWLSINLRNRLSQAVKNNQKSGSAVRDLGCSIEFLKQYLEAQFLEEMAWENRGKVWHIDHIEPLCSFNLTDREQFLIACHYTNLRPLFGPDNLKKSAEDRKKKFNQTDPNYSCLIELDLLEESDQQNDR